MHGYIIYLHRKRLLYIVVISRVSVRFLGPNTSCLISTSAYTNSFTTSLQGVQTEFSEIQSCVSKRLIECQLCVHQTWLKYVDLVKCAAAEEHCPTEDQDRPTQHATHGITAIHTPIISHVRALIHSILHTLERSEH